MLELQIRLLYVAAAAIRTKQICNTQSVSTCVYAIIVFIVRLKVNTLNIMPC